VGLWPELLSHGQVLYTGCHRLKQDINILSDRHSLLTSTLPLREGEWRKRERETYKLNIKSFINSTNNIINKRNNVKYPKPALSFPALGARRWCPGSTRQSWTGLGSRWELDSGMHGSESGSGSQAGQ